MKTLARQRDVAEVLRRLRRLRPDSERRWGRMSAHQMVCHLNDSFLMMTGRKQVSHQTSMLRRTVIKWIALYLPVRWPAGILTRPEIDQTLGGTTPVNFVADVAQLEAILNSVATRTRGFDTQQHPLFGRMSNGAWLRWAYLHTDHHLRQFGA
jgi:Protein of unknown function (DUF1569)